MGHVNKEHEVKCGPFENIFGLEINAIEESRRKRGIKDRPWTTKQDLIGLSFSGGGIRSATFNLGVIEGFARKQLLRNVDYLSTVSGGGYIGSWLSSWAYYLSRKTSDPNHIAQIESELSKRRKDIGEKPEPAQVRFLRRYSNYLTPRLGTLSGDTLAFVGTYIRNLLLNQTILVSLAFAFLAIPWIFGLGIPGFLYFWIPWVVAHLPETLSRWVFCATLFVTAIPALGCSYGFYAESRVI